MGPERGSFVIIDYPPEQCSRRYRIRIEGEIDPTWSDRLGGLQISTQTAEDETGRTTTLEGVLTDSSALAGVLTTLHTLNVTLLSVEIVDNKEEVGT